MSPIPRIPKLGNRGRFGRVGPPGLSLQIPKNKGGLGGSLGPGHQRYSIQRPRSYFKVTIKKVLLQRLTGKTFKIAICTPFSVKLPAWLKSTKLPFPGISRMWKKIDSSEEVQRKAIGKWGVEIDHGKTRRIKTVAVKGLIAIALKSRHAKVRELAMSYLALRRQAVPYLKAIVASRCSPTIKLRALKALAGAGYSIKSVRKQMKPFMDALYHDDPDVRQKAIEKVAKAKPDLAVPVLFAATKAGDLRVAEAAKDALVRIGVKSNVGFHAVLRMFGDQDCENKHTALAVLKRVLSNPKQRGMRHKVVLSLPVLEGALRVPDNKAATVALETLLQVRKVAKRQVKQILKKNMSSLIRLVKDGTEEQVSTAARCLTIVPDPKAAPALVDALAKLRDDSDALTQAARRYMKSLRSPQNTLGRNNLFPSLNKIPYRLFPKGLHSGKPFIYPPPSIQPFSGPSVKPRVKIRSLPLARILTDGTPSHVHEALVKIASGSDEGFRSVIEAIDKHDKKKTLIADRLEIIRDVCMGKKKLTPFVTYVALNSASVHMKSENTKLRKLAVEILDKVKTKRSVDLLIKGLDDDDPKMRQQCIRILARFKVTRAVPRLMDIANGDEVKKVRDAANQALYEIGQKYPGSRVTWL